MIRELHWHPNADEWHYVLNGSYDPSVFASEAQFSTSGFKQGHGVEAMGRPSLTGPNPISGVVTNLQIPESLAAQRPKANSDFAPQ